MRAVRVVVCDASCDGTYSFADLHNAMERCRIDFGVKIRLDDEDALKPTGAQGKCVQRFISSPVRSITRICRMRHDQLHQAKLSEWRSTGRPRLWEGERQFPA